MPMDTEKLTFTNWNAISTNEKIELAKALSKMVGAKFSKIEKFEREAGTCEIALFSKDDSTFALIPGGTVSLGYSENQVCTIPNDDLQAWKETLVECDEITDGETIHDYLKRILTPARSVTLKPFLIETEPRPTESIFEEFDDINDAEDGDDLSCHQIIAKMVSDGGYRLPTSDELEWAYSGASTDLFPWGKEPIRDQETESKFGSGVISAVPNAFGLYLNLDPYNCECTNEEMIMRGGDGGTRVCGGAFDTFITQACAYAEDIGDSDAIAEYYESALVRRVIPIQ